jgi:hypothetical protein
MTTDTVIDYLIANGRDPLEAVFLPLEPDLLAMVDDKKRRLSDQLRERHMREAEDEQRQSELDSRIKAALAQWPQDMRNRMAELIEERVQQRAAALQGRRRAAR